MRRTVINDLAAFIDSHCAPAARPLEEGDDLDEALRPLRELLRDRETFSIERTGEYTTKQNNHMEVNIMASIDFENIFKKVKDTAGNVADFTTKAAKNVAGKAQDTAKKTKLNAQIASEREALKKKYLELGKLYYEKYAGNTDPDFAEPVTAIEAGLERIAAKQAEIDALAVEEPEEPVADTEPVEPEMTVEAQVEPTEPAAEPAAQPAEDKPQE